MQKIFIGDKYDYSKVKYERLNKDVCIICPTHGEFWQTPNAHLRGGCPKCSFEQMGKYKTLTTEQFIEKAMKVHGNKYDYSKVEYKGNRYKVCIICPIHGEFWQTPNNHLNGNCCKKCNNENIKKNKTLSTEQFIQKAREIHKDKYNYSKTKYINNNTKVCIICPIHGEFWQTPQIHLSGSGCIICGKEKVSNKLKYTTEDFIKRAKEVHGDRYDYSKVEYKGALEKVCIICPTHGEFWQIPMSHINNESCCPKCINNQKYTTEDFIKRAKEVHGDRYDYSKVEYKNNYTKICIICNQKDKNGIIHGEFYTTPHSHLQGSKCPKCKFYSKLEEEVRKVLKENNINFIEQKTFNKLTYKSKLKIDFYLPEYNIAIECQGIQHYKPINFGGSIEKEKIFELNKLRDKIKKEFCEKNNIKLLYYTHEKVKDKTLIKSKERLINEIKKYDSK